MNITKGTILRTALLILAIINQILAAVGHSPLPISDEQLTEVVSTLLTTAAAGAAWWKNNSFTKAALIGDEAMHREKEKWWK